jgi:hypothetical protein
VFSFFLMITFERPVSSSCFLITVVVSCAITGTAVMPTATAAAIASARTRLLWSPFIFGA